MLWKQGIKTSPANAPVIGHPSVQLSKTGWISWENFENTQK